MRALYVRRTVTLEMERGLREQKERGYSCSHDGCDSERDECPTVAIARLADALDTAIDVIETERGGGVYPELPETLSRLRAVLKEVDRTA